MPVKPTFFNRSPFFIRLLHWEYWPFNLVYVPVAIYLVWLMIRARSFFFFSASNPSIETGGMMGESKWEIFKLMPEHLIPLTILTREDSNLEEVKEQMNVANISYPVVAKPDRGERGWMVAKIESDVQLSNYMDKVKAPFLIQNWVELPVELSVFYYRYPNAEKGIVSSVTVKELLHVTGDGQSTLRELIESYPRALLQLAVLEQQLKDNLNYIPASAEEVELVPFGNHSRGSKFMDGCYMIDEKMISVFDNISKQIPGFYFGRYDLRCTDIEALKEGRGFQIVELNGAGAEPAHIYQPGFSLIKAYSVLFHHFKVLYEISIMNHSNGTPFMTWKEFALNRKAVKHYKQKIQPT